jgi:Fe-S-cluster-containing dehydrogenase component
MSVNRRDFLKLSTAAAAAVGGSLAAATQEANAETSQEKAAGHYSMLNDCTKCIGCRACQNTCKRTHGLERAGDDPRYDMPTELSAHSLTLIQLYRESDQKWSFVKKQCLHCSIPSCVSVCPVSAFKKRDDGVVAYDESKCIGCRYCCVACPFNAPTFEYDKAAPVIKKCDFCKDLRLAKGLQPWCAEVCPKGAITFGHRGDLLAEAHKRINDNPDLYEPHVYGENEIGGTAVLYLAPKGITFEQLGYKMYGEVPPFKIQEDIQHGIFKFGIPPVALYGALALIAVATRRKETEPPRDGKEGR